jgi:hypothetical protein
VADVSRTRSNVVGGEVASVDGPDPGFGASAELGGGHPSGVGDLVSVDEALASDGLAVDYGEPPKREIIRCLNRDDARVVKRRCAPTLSPSAAA